MTGTINEVSTDEASLFSDEGNENQTLSALNTAQNFGQFSEFNGGEEIVAFARIMLEASRTDTESGAESSAAAGV